MTSTSKPSSTRKAAPAKTVVEALVGGTLADGTHFAAGDPLKVDAAQHAALIENGIVADPAVEGADAEADD